VSYWHDKSITFAIATGATSNIGFIPKDVASETAIGILNEYIKYKRLSFHIIIEILTNYNI
jgi:hypothetical protein